MCYRLLLPVLLILTVDAILPATLTAQVMLQMERYGTPQTRKFQPGEYLTFKTQELGQWTTEEIINLLPEDTLIVTTNRYLKPGEITALRIRRTWSQPLGFSTLSFGGGWLIFSAGAALVDPSDPFTWSDVMVAGISLALAALLIYGLRYRKFRFGKRRWLRIVDMNVTSKK